MLWNRQKPDENIRQAVSDVSAISANSGGATRRAISMVPVAVAGSHEIAKTNTLRFHQLLISLEGNQRTGCLRVVSPQHKSRSAILIYKGRVVGCLHGSKTLRAHYLQKDAHSHALAALASPGNVLDAYELPDELVLAAASLFNGNVVQLESTLTCSEMLDQAMRTVAATNLPGCAVVTTSDDEMVCMVYLHQGKIIGVFSARDGWLPPSYEVAMKYAQSPKRTKAMAAYMPVSSSQNTCHIGFSLTGLADLAFRRQRWSEQQLQAIDSVRYITSEGKHYSSDRGPAYEMPVKQPQYTRWSKDAISAVGSHNVFAICP